MGKSGCHPQLAAWLERPQARRISEVRREMCKMCARGAGGLGTRPLLAGADERPQALRSEAVPMDLHSDFIDLQPPTKGPEACLALRRLGSGDSSNGESASRCVPPARSETCDMASTWVVATCSSSSGLAASWVVVQNVASTSQLLGGTQPSFGRRYS